MTLTHQITRKSNGTRISLKRLKTYKEKTNQVKQLNQALVIANSNLNEVREVLKKILHEDKNKTIKPEIFNEAINIIQKISFKKFI